MKQKLFNWLDDRYQFSPMLAFMRKKEVPFHKHTVWYYMGGVAMFLFIVQVFTGILLVLYYQADEATAFESIRFLMTKVSFGWLIRSMHSWGANLMILFVFIHMFSTFFTRAFVKPRELTWVTGFLLLAMAFAFGFTGYLLPWNELAFFATKVGTDITGAVPFIGNALKVVMRGGDDVTGATLSRFYAIHIGIIPALFTVLLVIHLMFVQRQGMHVPDSVVANPEQHKRIPFFPNFLVRDMLIWLVVTNILLFLAVFFPWELGEPADPFAPAPEGIKPEWYFMFMFQTLKLLPAHILGIEGEVLGIVAFGVGGLLWMLVPFWEIKSKSGARLRPMRGIGLAVLVFIVVMTIWGYMA